MDSEEISDQESILSDEEQKQQEESKLASAQQDIEMEDNAEKASVDSNDSMSDASVGDSKTKQEPSREDLSKADQAQDPTHGNMSARDPAVGVSQISDAKSTQKTEKSKKSSKSVDKVHKRDKKHKKDKRGESKSSSKVHSSRKGKNESESRASTKDKKKKRKKDKDKGKKKGKRKDKKKKKRRKFHSDSSSSNSSEDSSEASSNWSLDDKGVDYGSPEKISDGSDVWEGRSAELYDSDAPPDYPLNTYHVKSKPRILVLEDFDDNGDIVQLQLDCMEMQQEVNLKSSRAVENLQLSYHDKKKKEELERNCVDHTHYQNRAMYGVPKPLALHNIISTDFIRGVMKNLTCPICQEMVTNPVIYKSCLHRFCSNCIETYNRQGKKECPLCRIAIGNRRQLRPDKNISALMSHLTDEFKKLNRMEELENIEIKRKMINEQKKLKEKKDKQKRIVNNEFRRKYAETGEERNERLAKEREEKGMPKKGSKGSAGFAGEGGGLDTNHVIKLIEEKKQGLPNILLPVDITLVLKLQHEQVVAGTLMVHKVRLMTNRQISLIHLAILIAHKNGLKEEEWPNFEFYPCLLTSQISDLAHEQLSVGGILRPFRFKMTIYEILQMIHPGEEDGRMTLELVYKKKALPQLMNQKTLIKQIQEQQAALHQQQQTNMYGYGGQFSNQMPPQQLNSWQVQNGSMQGGLGGPPVPNNGAMPQPNSSFEADINRNAFGM